MAQVKPATTLPFCTSVPANRIVPDPTRVTDGFIPLQNPPAQYYNYQEYNQHLWFEYLNDRFDEPGQAGFFTIFSPQDEPGTGIKIQSTAGSTTEDGGDLEFICGGGGVTSGAGGSVLFTCGAGVLSGSGGRFQVVTGSSDTGSSGAITLETASSINFNSGDIQISTGNALNGNTGSITLSKGLGSNYTETEIELNNFIIMQAANSSNASFSAGSINILAGNNTGGGTAGNVYISSGENAAETSNITLDGGSLGGSRLTLYQNKIYRRGRIEMDDYEKSTVSIIFNRPATSPLVRKGRAVYLSVIAFLSEFGIEEVTNAVPNSLGQVLGIALEESAAGQDINVAVSGVVEAVITGSPLAGHHVEPDPSSTGGELRQTVNGLKTLTSIGIYLGINNYVLLGV